MKATSPDSLSAGGFSSKNEWITPEFVSGMVSVIIPTYNRSSLVRQAIESLRVQTWSSLEIIVVDDGSEDDTLVALKDVTSLGEGRILHRLTQPHSGVSAARNLGTRASTGEFIIYLDSDDILVPDAIEHHVETLKRSGSDYCYGAIDSMDANGRAIPDQGRFHPDPLNKKNLITNLWLVHAACYRRSAILKVGPWNIEMSAFEDHEFLLRIKTINHGIHLPRVQGFYRMHGDNQLTQRNAAQYMFVGEMIMLGNYITWLEKRGPISPDIRTILVERCRFHAFRMAVVNNVEMKNQALSLMAELLKGSWSPRRLYLIGRWINYPKFYSGLAKFKRFMKG